MNRRNTGPWMALGVVLLAAAVTAMAQSETPVPARIGYQGTASGLLDGQDLTFTLHDAESGGTVLWTKTLPIQVDGDRFAVVLEGDSDTDPFPGLVEAIGTSAKELYIEILQDTTPLGARQRLASAPFAVAADRFVPTGAEVPPVHTQLPRVMTVNPDPVNVGAAGPGTYVLVARLEGFEQREGSLLKVVFEAHRDPPVPEDILTTIQVHIFVGGAAEASPRIVYHSYGRPGVPGFPDPPGSSALQAVQAEWMGPVASREPVPVAVEVHAFEPQQVEYQNIVLTVEEAFPTNEGLETVPPRAEFKVDAVRDSPPLRVGFTDLSDPGSAEIIEWHWDFGENLPIDPITGVNPNVSREPNPVHTYWHIREIPYSVSLRVVTADGEDIETKYDYITVEEYK